ncbi:MAG: UDP-N-acetylmuramoyl-tripeptide--D-alanyl-D-alanine ligase [Algisphaera sp.]
MPSDLKKKFWSFDHIVRVTDGEWIREPDANDPAPTGLEHDTRTLYAGHVYLAVPGERFDGHDYVAQAFAKGAALAIVSRDVGPAAAGPTLKVEDPVAALQELASAYRDTLAAGGCKVIAICGSNGKTSTRHMLHHTLRVCGLKGTESPKSFNNHLGVPLTLLAAHPDHDFVACEIGTNHPGEIEALSGMVWPDAAIITSIGREHMAFFKTLDGVAHEEAAVMRFVRPGGLVVAPADAARLMAPFYNVQENVILLPLASDEDVPKGFRLAGEHNRMNGALVLAVARWLDVNPSHAVAALMTATLPPGRMQSLAIGGGREAGGIDLIHDAYNANPDSVRAAIETLAAQPGRTVAVLGDMLELGDMGPAAHIEVLQHARELEISARLAVGPLMTAARDDSEMSWPNPEHAFVNTDGVADHIQAGDTVLLKGSRGMALERLIPVLEEKFSDVPF